MYSFSVSCWRVYFCWRLIMNCENVSHLKVFLFFFFLHGSLTQANSLFDFYAVWFEERKSFLLAAFVWVSGGANHQPNQYYSIWHIAYSSSSFWCDQTKTKWINSTANWWGQKDCMAIQWKWILYLEWCSQNDRSQA